MYDSSVVQRDLTEVGYTEVGCPRCDFMSTHRHARGCGYVHSTNCRNLINKAIGGTVEGRERLQRFEEKRSNPQIKLESRDGAPAHLRERDPCLQAGLAPGSPTAGEDAYHASPRHPWYQSTPLPAEPGEDEEEAQDARPMGEQEAMDDESAYAPSSPAGEDEQDMGLLLVMDVCPSLSRSACREEREELEDIIEETCVLSVVSGKRGNTPSKRQGAHPGDRG